MEDTVTTTLDFSKLPRHTPRRFVPEDATLSTSEEVTGLCRALLDRPIESRKGLDAWLLDRSEFEAALDQASSALYVAMTCQTDDKARAEAYNSFITTVEPAVKPLFDKLDRKYLDALSRFGAGKSASRMRVFDRNVRGDVDLFREANVPLQTEDAVLSQEYQAVTGAMNVTFDGRERTMPEMGKFLLEPDRGLRERAWRATASRRLAEKDKIEGLFEKMLALRQKIAANAGLSAVDYQFRRYHRFDYSPADCERFHRAVEKVVVPLSREIQLRRRGTMKLDALRPWDVSVDPEGRSPLKPFEKPEELIAGAEAAFTRVAPELGAQFADMRQSGLLDLASRKGKAPGGYMCALAEARKPFIFMNAVGVDRDVTTLLHEGGHAFHAFAAADEPLAAYRSAPLEFAEVASMGMELLAGDFLDVFYKGEDLRREKREKFEEVIGLLPWIATIDRFQHALYSLPAHTRDDRRAIWLETMARFGGGVVDWSGLDEERAHRWHAQLHIFQYPFYYIEYGIAQLGALGLWVAARKDRKKALAAYRKALSLGGSKPLPELFKAAGLPFDFSEKTIEPLVAAVAKELETL